MKKLLVLATLAALVACKQKGDTTTPKGIIITAVQALSEGRIQDFKNVLAEGALQKYAAADQQEQLKNQLGNMRSLQLSDEKILSHSTLGNSTKTVSQVDVLRSGNIVYNVITRCTETTTSTTRSVCHTYNPPDYNNRNGYDHGGYQGGGGNYDGGNGGSYRSGNDGGSNNGGGGTNHDYVTPGSSHESGGSGDGGSKPGNEDPNRPGRFPMIEATSTSLSVSSECEDVVDQNTTVSCKIIDVK